MNTTIVNIKNSKFDVYIGRRGHGYDGYFGNPIVIGRKCVCGITHCSGGSTLECYRTYFYSRLDNDPMFKCMIEELRGKRLGCFCKPDPCHGDIIVEYLDEGITGFREDS